MARLTELHTGLTRGQQAWQEEADPLPCSVNDLPFLAVCKRSRSRALGSREQLPQAAKPASHVPSTCQSRGRTRAGSYCGSSWECSWRTLIPLSQMRTLTLSQGEELSQVAWLEGHSQDSKESVLSSPTRVRSGRHTSLSLCVCLSLHSTNISWASTMGQALC